MEIAKFTVTYSKVFVSGNLKGLSIDDEALTYPMSMLADIEEGFKRDIATKREINGIGSGSHVITGYSIKIN